jgi:hypothetical protein
MSSHGCALRPTQQLPASSSSSSDAGATNITAFRFHNVYFSYTARRLDANTYQFEELALKAMSMKWNELAVELLINSLAVDDQQEETWCAGLNPQLHIASIASSYIRSFISPNAPARSPPCVTQLARYRLGNAFHELKLDYHAAACYRRCLALNRNDLRYWNDLGSAYISP